jgi:mRNA-degrading endonuclease RelE of RelBE toxin-antitoxin system
MKWAIEYSRDADRFMQAEAIQDDCKKLIEGFLRKLQGGSVNIDVKKLKGQWKGYFRIRKRRLRIIFSIDFLDFRFRDPRIASWDICSLRALRLCVRIFFLSFRLPASGLHE